MRRQTLPPARSMTVGRRLTIIIVAGLASGCAAYRPANKRLNHWDPAYGYRPQSVQAHRPVGDVLLLLAFSGGGTRAAAFSYGVLQELRNTRVVVGGQEKRLLDEVDLITSVSGGSFTVAYYALFGDRIFADFETALSAPERLASHPARAAAAAQLVSPGRFLLRPHRAGDPALRRRDLRPRHVRRSAGGRRPARPDQRGRPRHRQPLYVLPATVRPHLL